MAGTQRKPMGHPLDAVVSVALGITPEVTAAKEAAFLATRKVGTTRRKVAPADPVIQAVEAAESQGQDGYLAGIMARQEAETERDNALEAFSAQRAAEAGESDPIDAVSDAIGADVLEATAGSPYEAKFKLDFGSEYEEVLKAWKLLHSPGVLLGLKMAVDLHKNPPEIDVEGKGAFRELRDALKVEMLASIDDIAKAVGEQILGSDEAEELLITDEDIPDFVEKLDEAKEAALKVARNEVAALREAVSKTIDNAEESFKDDIVAANMGPEAEAFSDHGVVQEAAAAILYLRQHHGELG